MPICCNTVKSYRYCLLTQTQLSLVFCNIDIPSIQESWHKGVRSPWNEKSHNFSFFQLGNHSSYPRSVLLLRTLASQNVVAISASGSLCRRLPVLEWVVCSFRVFLYVARVVISSRCNGETHAVDWSLKIAIVIRGRFTWRRAHLGQTWDEMLVIVVELVASSAKVRGRWIYRVRMVSTGDAKMRDITLKLYQHSTTPLSSLGGLWLCSFLFRKNIFCEIIVLIFTGSFEQFNLTASQLLR